MPWTDETAVSPTSIEAMIEAGIPLQFVQFPDGRIAILVPQIRFEVIRSPKHSAINRLFTKIGDILTAGRRRSWFFEGIYSKTTPGFIGYWLARDVIQGDRLPFGKNRTSKDGKADYSQYRMSWDRMSSKWMKYRF